MYHVVVRHNLHLRKLTINAVLLAVALFSLSVILAKGLSASPQHSKYLGLDLLLAVALELLLGLFERCLMEPFPPPLLEPFLLKVPSWKWVYLSLRNLMLEKIWVHLILNLWQPIYYFLSLYGSSRPFDKDFGLYHVALILSDLLLL